MLDHALYRRMYRRAARIITGHWGLALDEIVLVGDGSAWASHLAVQLFLSDPDARSLEIYLPCAFNTRAGHMVVCPSAPDSSGRGSGATGGAIIPCARLLNKLHGRFGRAVFPKQRLGYTLTTQMRNAARAEHCQIHTRTTQQDRCRAVAARAMYMIAFSFDTTCAPSSPSETTAAWQMAIAGCTHAVHVSVRATDLVNNVCK